MAFAPIVYPWSEPPAEGEATQVAPGILWMRLPLPMALDHVNAYALDDGDGWTIIDTGLASKRGRALWERLLAGPLGGRPVNRLIVTHHHPDHVGLAGWFQREQGAELWMTRTAWLMARMLTLDVQEVWPDETLAFYKAAGMDPEVFAKRAADRPFNFADMVVPMPLGFTRLSEGDHVTMGGRDWHVRIGNGHAPAHATFWCDADSLVLAGDQILSSISPNIGVYPTEPDADPLADWLEACERFRPFAREEHLVLGGHKLPFTGLPTRMRQLIENHHGALTRLMDHLSEPRKGGQCFTPLFKRQIGPGEYGLALVETIAHLNHLYQADRITRTKDDDGAWIWQAKEERFGH